MSDIKKKIDEIFTVDFDAVIGKVPSEKEEPAEDVSSESKSEVDASE